MIVLKTHTGSRSPSTFPFKSFVPACLFIMKTGLIMQGVFVIPKSRYLEVVLPEANNLDLYSISKPSFTQTKNNIYRVVRETLELEAETPQGLKSFVDTELKKISTV